MRIVSLLPSATEIICGIGLKDSLVGVTHECDFPHGVAALPKVTRTAIAHDASSGEIDQMVRERLKTERALYSLDMPVLEKLRPDLIVTQALCDVCAVAESEVQSAACSLPGNPSVINLEPNCLADVLDCIGQVGEATESVDQATALIDQLQSRVRSVRQRSETIQHRPRTILLEWIDPPFSAGHWSPELVEIAGGSEAIGKAGQRSVTTAWKDIVQANPEFMMIACCGFGIPRTMNDVPLLRAMPGWGELACVKAGRVYVVDGSAYFSRPGPRLVDSLEIMAHAMHPKTHSLPAGLSAALCLKEEELG